MGSWGGGGKWGAECSGRTEQSDSSLLLGAVEWNDRDQGGASLKRSMRTRGSKGTAVVICGSRSYRERNTQTEEEKRTRRGNKKNWTTIRVRKDGSVTATETLQGGSEGGKESILIPTPPTKSRQKADQRTVVRGQQGTKKRTSMAGKVFPVATEINIKRPGSHGGEFRRE